MKKIVFFALLITMVVGGCTQNKAVPETRIDNTLKSVTFFYDSVGIDPHLLFLSLEQMNKAIDSIGYPDAGYKVWLVQSDTNKAYRFMIEGYWPNQAIYDTIHNSVLYKDANEAVSRDEIWKALKDVSYNRFTLVK